MPTQARTILGALEYSLETLKGLKRNMLDVGGKRQKTAFTIGGTVVIIAANLIKTCQEVIEQSIKSENPNAVDDLREIQTRFNEFINMMIEGKS